MGIKLSCLACGHSLEIGDAYESYRGVVRCWVCRAVLDVALEQGMVREMRLASSETRRAEGDPTSRQES